MTESGNVIDWFERLCKNKRNYILIEQELYQNLITLNLNEEMKLFITYLYFNRNNNPEDISFLMEINKSATEKVGNQKDIKKIVNAICFEKTHKKELEKVCKKKVKPGSKKILDFAKAYNDIIAEDPNKAFEDFKSFKSTSENKVLKNT